METTLILVGGIALALMGSCLLNSRPRRGRGAGSEAAEHRRWMREQNRLWRRFDRSVRSDRPVAPKTSAAPAESADSASPPA